MLFGLAYRMLGSVMDAEDIVQEAFLRWQQVAGATVEEPRAYLTTVVTRLCIDHLRSARVRREQYVGPWLPEPLVTDQEPEVSNAPALAESLSMAFLVLLETLTPQERAVFLLHEVFGYSFGEIAAIIGKSEANCRQIAGRARKHVEERRPRFDASPDQQERLLRRFVQASTSGDMDALLSLLADDVTLWADGGGKVQPAALQPIHGAKNVARGALAFLSKAPPSLAVRFASVNGRPGIIAEVDGQPVSVLTIEVVGDRIQTIHAIANPDKLAARPLQLH
jgi:RNA polymerase sigma-70 factor (ECF subfamily)